MDFLSTYQQLQILGYVALAMLLGDRLGLDRKITYIPAGLRSHTMVCEHILAF
jgi:uncharacterized membrane protein YhiD involved in acid resistance